jgi:E3 ubiquitin-protein ligase TRAF7
MDPVISIQCGHTFCRRCVESVEEHRPAKCPVDETPYELQNLVINRAIQGQVEELQIYCCHGLTRVDSEEDFVLDDDGCPEIISLGHRDMHEESCQFALVPCPNGSNYCGKVRQKDLEEHLCNCVSFPCPFRESGCGFRGQQSEVNVHKSSCGFRGVKVANVSQNLEFQQLRNVCEQLVFALRGLTDKVSTLEQRLDTAESLVDHQNQVIKDLRLQNSTMAHQLNDLLAKKNGPPLLTQTPTQTDSRSRRGHNRSASLTVNMTRSSDTESSPTASSQHVSQISAVLASPAVLKIETWSMPFTFKCIGTFRYSTS